MKKSDAELQYAAERYIRAIHEGDIVGLTSLFYEPSHLYSTDDDGLVDMPVADYLTMVADRQSPKDAGHSRQGRVLSVDTIAADKAVVKVEVAVPPKRFTDFLVFIRQDNEWKIVTKVYHMS